MLHLLEGSSAKERVKAKERGGPRNAATPVFAGGTPFRPAALKLGGRAAMLAATVWLFALVMGLGNSRHEPFGWPFSGNGSGEDPSDSAPDMGPMDSFWADFLALQGLDVGTLQRLASQTAPQTPAVFSDSQASLDVAGSLDSQRGGDPSGTLLVPTERAFVGDLRGGMSTPLTGQLARQPGACCAGSTPGNGQSTSTPAPASSRGNGSSTTSPGSNGSNGQGVKGANAQNGQASQGSNGQGVKGANAQNGQASKGSNGQGAKGVKGQNSQSSQGAKGVKGQNSQSSQGAKGAATNGVGAVHRLNHKSTASAASKLGKAGKTSTQGN